MLKKIIVAGFALIIILSVGCNKKTPDKTSVNKETGVAGTTPENNLKPKNPELIKNIPKIPSGAENFKAPTYPPSVTPPSSPPPGY